VHSATRSQQQDACLARAKNQPAGVEKRRRRGLPVSGLFFTGSCATRACEGYFFFFAARRFFGGGLYTMPSSFMPSGSVK
jgi:hypothetical protein